MGCKSERELTALEFPILTTDFVPISAPSRVLKELQSMPLNLVTLRPNGNTVAECSVHTLDGLHADEPIPTGKLTNASAMHHKT